MKRLSQDYAYQGIKQQQCEICVRSVLLGMFTFSVRLQSGRGCKVIHKVAYELSKPDGLLEVAVGDEVAFHVPLPMVKLTVVGKETEGILRG